MIACGGKWIWQSSENARSIVMDLRGFAVHQPLGVATCPPKTSAMHCDPGKHQAKARSARTDARLLRLFLLRPVFRVRRDANMCRLQFRQFHQAKWRRYAEQRVHSQARQILDEVVSERIVIIEDEQHGFAWLRRPDESPSLPHELLVLGKSESLRAIGERSGRIIMHFHDKSIGACGGSGASQRRHHIIFASAM